MEVNEMKETKTMQDYIDAAIGLGCLVGTGVLGYVIGKKVEGWKVASGLNRACIVHPEIEDLIKDACEKLNNKS